MIQFFQVNHSGRCGMNVRLVVRACTLAAMLVAVFVPVTSAGKPGPGSSEGTGRVFFPNPVATLQDQTLTDRKDADYSALQPAYRIVTLTDLDGSGYLSGNWANITSNTGTPAYSTSNTFLFNRHDDRF